MKGSTDTLELNIRSTIYTSLKSLLKQDEGLALAFLQDRHTLGQIVKMVTGRTKCSHVYRSAGLYCMALAFRFARADSFAAEVCLPLFIAGALSGGLAFPTPARMSTSCAAGLPMTSMSPAQELLTNTAIWPLVNRLASLSCIEVITFKGRRSVSLFVGYNASKHVLKHEDSGLVPHNLQRACHD